MSQASSTRTGGLTRDKIERARSYPIKELVESVAGLRMKRTKPGEYAAVCPLHKDKNPSFYVDVNKNVFWCFGCQAKSSPIDFVMHYEGLPFVDAVRRLVGAEVHTLPRRPEPPPKDEQGEDKPDWVPLMPAPKAVPACISHPTRGEPDAVHTYRNAQGEVLFLACVFRRDDGEKDVLPYTCGQWQSGAHAWRWKAPATQGRPLYGLDRLAAMPGKPVIVCEGEKTADAAQELLPDHPCISWMGGTQATGRADWSALKGRKVAVVPDLDKPGVDCVWGTDGKTGLLQRIRAAGAKEVKPVVPTAMLNEAAAAERKLGWDLADALNEGWQEAKTWLRRHVDGDAPRPTVFDQPDDSPPDPPEDEAPPPEFEDAPPEEAEPVESDGPAAGPVPLGHNNGFFFYYNPRSGQVQRLAQSSHTKQMLMGLPSLEYWEGSRFSGKKGPKWDEIGNFLMQSCYDAGVYDPTKVRGRGAWIDRGRSVLHLGETLLVDQEAYDPSDFGETAYVYQRSRQLLQRVRAPLRPRTSESAYGTDKLVEACTQLLRWENPLHGKLVAGWIVTSVICGAMYWRPSIWITGPSGSGKSWVLDNVVIRLLQDVAFNVQSKTTEAGIRQTLEHDALPVVFDEAEQEDLQSKQRMQGVMDLVRQASSEGGGVIAKGTQTQSGAATYTIRSAFCFCSINVGIQQFADESRITILKLAAPPSDAEAQEIGRESFERLQEIVHEVFTPEYGASLMARASWLAPMIRRNHAIFARAAAEVYGSQRVGDQIGGLLAGYWSLLTERDVTLDEARSHVASGDWVDDSLEDAEPDHVRLLRTLMERNIRVQTTEGAQDMPVGEVIDAARHGMASLGKSEAARVLLRHGIRYEIPADGPDCQEGIWVGNAAHGVQALLRGTPWESKWKLLLRRFQRAQPSQHPVRFAGSTPKQRATFLPMINLEEGDT